MSEFKMPSLGADMEAGTLVGWQKQPGQRVEKGETIADVETDKGVIAVESFHSGILDHYVASVGARVPVGTVLAILRDDGTQPASVVSSTATPQAQIQSPVPSSTVPAVVVQPVTDSGRLPMSPAARRLARELGVDAHCVTGTGPSGAITREDIERAANAMTSQPKAIAPAVPQPTEDRGTRFRQTIAAAMARSKREIPHYYLSTTIDMHATMTWLTMENEKRPVAERLIYGVMLLKAVAIALQRVPELNATWNGHEVVLQPDIHVGVAISLRQGGLIAPALRQADRKSLHELMGEFRDLVNRARSGGLRSSELVDPTITVTSLGENGVETVFGVIYPPQVAIVGFGKLVERPWSVDGRIVSRPTVIATLSADHRVSDGHRGGLFLSTVERLLQEPGQL